MGRWSDFVFKVCCSLWWERYYDKFEPQPCTSDQLGQLQSWPLSTMACPDAQKSGWWHRGWTIIREGGKPPPPIPLIQSVVKTSISHFLYLGTCEAWGYMLSQERVFHSSWGIYIDTVICWEGGGFKYDHTHDKSLLCKSSHSGTIHTHWKFSMMKYIAMVFPIFCF